MGFISYKELKKLGIIKTTRGYLDDYPVVKTTKHRNSEIKTTFICECYNDPDSECGYVFYFNYKGIILMGRCTYLDEEYAIKDGKETYDSLINFLFLKET